MAKLRSLQDRCGPFDDEVARDTAARKYTDHQVEASLPLSIYSYATSMNGLADQEDRLRFDVRTKTRRASPACSLARGGRALRSPGARRPRAHGRHPAPGGVDLGGVDAPRLRPRCP